MIAGRPPTERTRKSPPCWTATSTPSPSGRVRSLQSSDHSPGVSWHTAPSAAAQEKGRPCARAQENCRAAPALNCCGHALLGSGLPQPLSHSGHSRQAACWTAILSACSSFTAGTSIMETVAKMPRKAANSRHQRRVRHEREIRAARPKRRHSSSKQLTCHRTLRPMISFSASRPLAGSRRRAAGTQPVPTLQAPLARVAQMPSREERTATEQSSIAANNALGRHVTTA
mmetsp:Transcript_39658/g.114446  ORF Transcript_39658/g.114446 Transcript_39658/m.114446 type:complete len:229 (+) Transcript_39658:426-1112(+)